MNEMEKSEILGKIHALVEVLKALVYGPTRAGASMPTAPGVNVALDSIAKSLVTIEAHLASIAASIKERG